MTGPGHPVIGRSSQVGVTVGLVGLNSFLQRTIDLARQLGQTALRLLPAMCSSIARIGYAVEKALGQVESIRFAGPLPYDGTVATLDVELPCIVVPYQVGMSTLRMMPAPLTLRQPLTTAILAGSGSGIWRHCAP